MSDGPTDEIACVMHLHGVAVVDVVDDADDKWYGGSHARHQGMTHACMNRIASVGADTTFLRKDAAEALISQYQLQGEKGLLSIQPYHITKCFYEGFSVIFSLVTAVGMNVFSTLDDGRTNQHTFGPVTLANKEDYYATGGHKSANRHTIERFALGSAYTSQSSSVTVYEGSPSVAFRMYQEGFQSLQEGWTKHLSAGAGGTKSKIMAAIVLQLFGSITSILGLYFSLRYRQMSVGKMSAVYLSYTIQFTYLHRRIGQFSNLSMVYHPLLFMFFIRIFIQSWKQTHYYGVVEWKGRQYSISKEQ